MHPYQSKFNWRGNKRIPRSTKKYPSKSRMSYQARAEANIFKHLVTGETHSAQTELCVAVAYAAKDELDPQRVDLEKYLKVS